MIDVKETRHDRAKHAKFSRHVRQLDELSIQVHIFASPSAPTDELLVLLHSLSTRTVLALALASVKEAVDALKVRLEQTRHAESGVAPVASLVADAQLNAG